MPTNLFVHNFTSNLEFQQGDQENQNSNIETFRLHVIIQSGHFTPLIIMYIKNFQMQTIHLLIKISFSLRVSVCALNECYRIAT